MVSRTYKDKPDRLATLEQSEDESLFEFMRKHNLDESQQVFVKRYLYKTPNHGRLMRTFAGAFCSNKSCCRKKPKGERQREKREWRKLIAE